MFFTMSLLELLAPLVLFTNLFMTIASPPAVPFAFALLSLVPSLFFGAAMFYESSSPMPRRPR